MNRPTAITLMLAATALHVTSANAAPLDKIQFVKISPQDAKAVIKVADGKLQVIKPGDAIGETVTVKEIASGRIVLEEKTDKGLETIIVRLESGKSRMERLSKMPESRPLLVAPARGDK